ncbi:MAG TPA: response regulator transcription factor [Ktedonobacterales bacterium]|nr:response regulator transcription factor [Ktedonobacterales bacterium]
MSEAGKTAEKTILVVDDEPDIALVLTTTFEDAGYRVAAVERGDDVERVLTADTPDLILLDMLLSGRDGREIVRHLKAQQATRPIPILMLSAHPSAEQEARGAGADDFLAKPFDLDVLLAKVAACLRRSHRTG